MAINWKHYYSDALLRIFVRTPHEEKFRELAEYLEANFNYRSHGDPSESNRCKMSREVIDDHISRFRELRTNQHFAGINLNELTLERVTLLLLKVLPSSRINPVLNNGVSTLLRFYGSFLAFCLIEELGQDLDARHIPWRSQ